MPQDPSVAALFDSQLLDSTQSPGVFGYVLASTGKGTLWLHVSGTGSVVSVNGHDGPVVTLNSADVGIPMLTLTATANEPGSIAFLTDATYAAPFFPTTDPTSVTIIGSKSLSISETSMGSTTTLAALDLSNNPTLQSFTYSGSA